MHGRAFCAAGLVGALVYGCGGSDLLEPASIALFDGDGQRAPAGARLAIPLTVAVGASDGSLLPRAEVRWTVIEGEGATLSDPVTQSDGVGLAQAVLTLGPTAGTYRVRAALLARADRAVSFEAEATEPPVLTEVTPASFTDGEEVTLRGQRLRSGLTVLIGGVPAEVTALSPTGQGLTAVVPRCLVPGTVPIQAIVQGAPSNELQGTYVASTAAVQLGVGQYVSIDGTALSGCARFPATFAEREYLFMVQAATGQPGSEVAYQFRGDSGGATAAARPPAADSLPLALRFHDRLRALEAEYARLPKPPTPPGVAEAALAEIRLGDRLDLRVCSHVECSVLADFKEVSARARYVGDHAAIFVDDAAPGGGLDSANLAALGAVFDDHLYELATRAFGVESDVDRNGRVIILMTPVVNGMTPKAQCETSIITGFFHAIDVDPAFSNDARSNRGEVFYTLTPDPTGSVTCQHSVDRIRRVVPVTFIHEFQHMISFNQHVLVRGGDTELLWLNEAMSHLAEELGGLHFLDLGDTQRFSDFVIGDLFNAYQYLREPGAHFLVAGAGTGTLAERGTAWLFLRWVLDQSGENLLRRLSETRLRGAANVEAATAAPFPRLVAEWALANYVSDLPDFAAPARLRYRDWRFRTTYADLHERLPERFDRPFPLVPQQFTGGSFAVSGTLRAGSGDYFLIAQGPAHAGFTVSLTTPTGETIDGAFVPRVNVIRIR